MSSSTSTPRTSSLAEVAERLAGARRLLVGTGAGMSADSGIGAPDGAHHGVRTLHEVERVPEPPAR